MLARRSTIGLFCFSLTHLAQAEGMEVATARQLAIQGIDAVESGDCSKGAPLLERAERLHHASVHLQYLARCQLARGKLVAATEMWRQIIREGAPPGASPAIVGALGEATAQLEKMLPSLSTTTIHSSARYPNLELELDGTPLPADIVGAPQILDPGTHELKARASGYVPWSKEWTVAAGGTAELSIELEPAPADASAATENDPRRTTRLLEPAGWITASVGAASIVAGTVTTLMRNNRRSELENDCKARLCPAGYPPGKLHDDTDAITSLTTASNVLLFGGGALLAGGVVLIVVGRGSAETAPSGTTAVLAGAPGAAGGLTLRGCW